MQPVSGAIRLDVLILGGGIQGLWLLKDLHAKYSTLLLEPAGLGSGQTAHSHTYLHEGHFFGSRCLRGRLEKARSLWLEWLGTKTIRPVVDTAYCLFTTLGSLSAFDQRWRNQLSLRVDPHPAFPSLRRLYEIGGLTFDSNTLLFELRRDAKCPKYARQLGAVEGIFASGGGRSIQVTVRSPRGEVCRLEPRALVLAAGASNEALIEMVDCANRRPQGPQTQQFRLTHMLVIEEKEAGLLPAFTGQILPAGVFVASRRREDRTVWLVSDGKVPSRLARGSRGGRPESTDGDKAEFVRSVMEGLREAGPVWLEQEDRLKWGVYAALKAEGDNPERPGDNATGCTADRPDQLPQTEAVRELCFRGGYAVWPNLLSLAPLASDEITRMMPEPHAQGNPWPELPTELSAWPELLEFPGETWTFTAMRDRQELRNLLRQVEGGAQLPNTSRLAVP